MRGGAFGAPQTREVDYRRRSEIGTNSLLFHGAITPFTREVVVITVAGDLASSFRWLQWRDRAGIAPASHFTLPPFGAARHRGELYRCKTEIIAAVIPARSAHPQALACAPIAGLCGVDSCVGA
jgi:hypothetical protein